MPSRRAGARPAPAYASARTVWEKIGCDYFIFFKPKDIVSGDFYWANLRDNSAILAAVDCTGHGVAGAFMSMIGTALLNQIVNEKGITEPSKILTQLNDGIVTSLKQRESEMNEGMDIALCTINNKNKTS